MGFVNSLSSFCKKCFEDMGGRDAATRKIKSISDTMRDYLKEKSDNAKDLLVHGQSFEQVKRDENKKKEPDNEER